MIAPIWVDPGKLTSEPRTKWGERGYDFYPAGKRRYGALARAKRNHRGRFEPRQSGDSGRGAQGALRQNAKCRVQNEECRALEGVSGGRILEWLDRWEEAD